MVETIGTVLGKGTRRGLLVVVVVGGTVDELLAGNTVGGPVGVLWCPGRAGSAQ